MSAHAAGPLRDAPAPNVRLDIYTSDYRVSGMTASRFSRVADIVNALTDGYLAIARATFTEHGDPTLSHASSEVLVALDEILFVIAPEVDGAARPEMRIVKEAFRVELALPPFRIEGSMHVFQQTRPIDGLMNTAERFVTITEAEITSAIHPGLERSASAVAVQRARAQLVAVSEDEG
jgi:hypothetical protein